MGGEKSQRGPEDPPQCGRRASVSSDHRRWSKSAGRAPGGVLDRPGRVGQGRRWVLAGCRPGRGAETGPSAPSRPTPTSSSLPLTAQQAVLAQADTQAARSPPLTALRPAVFSPPSRRQRKVRLWPAGRRELPTTRRLGGADVPLPSLQLADSSLRSPFWLSCAAGRRTRRSRTSRTTTTCSRTCCWCVLLRPAGCGRRAAPQLASSRPRCGHARRGLEADSLLVLLVAGHARPAGRCAT